MCSTSRKFVSCEREVDSPLQCDTLPVETIQENGHLNTEPKEPCGEMCLPLSRWPQPEASIPATNQLLCETGKSYQKSVHKPSTPETPVNMSLAKSAPIPLRVGLSKLIMFLMAFCLPIGGSFCQGSNDQCKPVMVCLPGQPHITEEDKCKKEKEEIKPIGLITRNKEADFIGGKFIYGCTCGRKNGLQGECPRLSCQNNPGCSMNPPRCWPQFKEPEKPVLPPDQKMICVPIQLVYYDPSKS